MNRQALVDTARRLVGTPYRDEGRSRTGVDCYGLLLVVAQAHGLAAPVEAGYGSRPSGLHMRRQLLAYCDPVPFAAVSPGDILHLRYGDQPQHLALVSAHDPLRIVHADSRLGRVVEQSLAGDAAARVRGCYRVRG